MDDGFMLGLVSGYKMRSMLRKYKDLSIICTVMWKESMSCDYLGYTKWIWESKW